MRPPRPDSPLPEKEPSLRPEKPPPAKELPAKELPGKELPGKGLPAKELPGNELPAKELPAKELPEKEPAGPSAVWPSRRRFGPLPPAVADCEIVYSLLHVRPELGLLDEIVTHALRLQLARFAVQEASPTQVPEVGIANENVQPSANVPLARLPLITPEPG